MASSSLRNRDALLLRGGGGGRKSCRLLAWCAGATGTVTPLFGISGPTALLLQGSNCAGVGGPGNLGIVEECNL
eukprot:3942979-Heterocapsa_arctica.AAC.1